LRYCGGIFDWDSAATRLAELNKRAEDPNLWNNPQSAQKVMRQRQALERALTGYQRLEREFDDALTLIELGEGEGDKASVEEGEAGLRKIAEEARRQEVEALLSGEADGNDTYVEVHAGAGIDLDVAVVAVGLARQQGLELGPPGHLLQPPQLLAGVVQGGLVALHVGQFGVLQGVLELALQGLHRLDRIGQAGALAHDRLGVVRPIPQGRVLDPGVQFVEFTERGLPVKDAS